MLVEQGKARGRVVKGDHPICAVVTGHAANAVVFLVASHTRWIMRGMAVHAAVFGERKTCGSALVTRQAIHGRRVEVDLVQVQAERRMRMVEAEQRRLDSVEVLSLVLWMARPACLDVLDHAVDALSLRDLVGDGGMARQTQRPLGCLQRLMAPLTLGFKLGVRRESLQRLGSLSSAAQVARTEQFFAAK